LRSEVERVAPLVGLSHTALLNLAQAEANARYDRLTNVTDGKANPAALTLRRENLRLGKKVADLLVMRDALDAMVAHRRERPHPVTTEQLVEPAIPLRVLREGREAPKPYYLICRAGKIYAAFVFAEGSLQPNRQDLSWIMFPGGRRSRCLPIEDRGWNVAEAGERLKTIGPQLQQHPDYYAVVLAFPDSFSEARQLLQLLDTANVAFSWRPHAAGEAVDFAVDGAIPPPPL
ncbi:MAG: hypothetical protein ABIZ81_17660, partial [Opitutaceae bacterium]